MPTERRRAMRPGLSAWSRARARVRQGGSGDGGFTMIEMMVSLIIISIVMTALGSFFVSTVSAASRQGSKQAAIQLADSAMEQVHALAGSALVSRRDKNSSDTQWSAPAPGVGAYQADMNEAYDSTAATGDGATANLPTTGVQTTINNLVYTENWYVGTCFQAVGGGTCGKTATVGYVGFYRVVVAITWNDTVCAAGKCSYIASTLVSNANSEPTFLSNLAAVPPTIVNPNNQISDITIPVSLQLAATGGAGVITWGGSLLPTGLSISTSGLISGTPSALGLYSVTITATDSFGLVGSATFAWTINALPVITNPGTQTDEVSASASYTPILTGGTGNVTWKATGLPSGLSIVASGGTISGTPDASGTSSVTLTATDSLNQIATMTFTWIINPALQVTTPPDQTTGANATVSLTVAATGGVTPYSWSTNGLPGGLSISSAGVISGKPTVGGVYTVKVTVGDANGASVSTNNFKWTVVALNVTSPTNNLSSTKGTAITQITAAAAGGTGTGYTWSVVGASLPAGLGMTSGGVISGTPTTAKAYTVTLKVTDSAGGTDTTVFAWTINTTPNITNPISNQASTAGRAIVPITAAAAGGTGDYAWSATGFPTGVSIDSDTGVISGTFPTAGSFGVVIKVTDDAGATDSQSLTWTVNAAPSITKPTTDQTSTAGKSISSITATSTGGTGTKTWTSTGLPSGVSISTAGVISGTFPSARTYSVTITVTDSLGATDSQSITWTVNAAVNITSPTGNQSTKKNASVSLTAQATGGTGDISWSMTGQPTGININSSTGAISGKPTSTAKKYTVKITATDDLGATDTFTFTWTVTS